MLHGSPCSSLAGQCILHLPYRLLAEHSDFLCVAVGLVLRSDWLTRNELYPEMMQYLKLWMMLPCSLEGYMGIMDRSARLLVDELSWAAGKESIDIQQPIQDMTLNVVGQSAFGYAVPIKL